MLAFARASQGTLVAVDCDSVGANIAAYGVAGRDRSLSVTIINKETSLDASVTLSVPGDFGDGRVLRLSAPSLEAKNDVTFGSSRVLTDGTWSPKSTEWLPHNTRHRKIQVAAGSAAILRWPRSAML